MRPLYLDGISARGMEVILDGPALRVHQPGRADGLYPLRLLSRIVVSGEVRWETGALLQVMESGIPVVFLGRKGHVRGYCLGERVRRTTLAERLESFLELPGWEDRYRDWYAAEERRSILWIVRRLHLPEEDLRPGAVREAIDAHLAALIPLRQVHRGRALLQGWHRGLAAEQVAAFGLRPSLAAREGFDLARDITRIAGWELNLGLARAAGWLRKRARQTSFDEPKGRRRLLNEFEGWSGHLGRRHQGLLEGLGRWLLELG